MMDEIKTAQWEESRIVPLPFGVKHKLHSKVWIQLDPPAKAWRNLIGNEWDHNVIDARGQLHTASTWDTCSLFPEQAPIDAFELLDEVYAPSLQDADDRAAYESLFEETLQEGGRNLCHISCHYVQDHFNITLEWWAEPETRRLVRKTRREVDVRTGKVATEEVSNNFAYNVLAPPGTFDMPLGKPIEEVDIHQVFPDVWPSMSPQAQAQIRELINDLSSAWMNADNRRFADIWHFNALKGLPGKKEWLTRLAQQRGLWRKWDIQIAEVRKMNSIAVWLTSHSCSMIRAADTLDVKAELRVESARSGKNWTGKTDISIKQERGRYRIIYWHCPFEEILAATSPERGAT